MVFNLACKVAGIVPPAVSVAALSAIAVFKSFIAP
jgi:hypothetical protein